MATAITMADGRRGGYSATARDSRNPFALLMTVLRGISLGARETNRPVARRPQGRGDLGSAAFEYRMRMDGLMTGIFVEQVCNSGF